MPHPSADAAMPGYSCIPFSARAAGADAARDVYQRGQGAPVVILPEVTGSVAETARLADAFVRAGFRAVVPDLLGRPGGSRRFGQALTALSARRPPAMFRVDASSPMVEWLRVLCRDVRDAEKANGVGVVGMGMSGGFAISLMADESAVAGVAVEPALPFLLLPAELQMSDAEMRAIRRALDRKGPMLAFRFEHDAACGEGFAALAGAFNDDGTERILLNALPGRGRGVFTRSFVDEPGHPTRQALETVLRYFRDRLVSHTLKPARDPVGFID